MFHSFIEDGTYKVVIPCTITVTGNAGIWESKYLMYGEILLVKNGTAFFQARYSIAGEMLKILNNGNIEKLF